MKRFIVLVREVHVLPVSVEANDVDEAIRRVRGGAGEHLTDHLEYSHTLDPKTWTVEEVP